MISRTLELCFIDGKPDGMHTAEVFNWTGRILVTPRTRLAEALKRKESDYTGVYILLGEQDEEGLAYIGEGESISNRIKSHDSKKDWWTKAILITSAANNLNKAHVQYLEARLVQIAQDAAKTKLENGNNPSTPSLSEAAQANMEGFLDPLMMVLPALGVDLFDKKTHPSILETQKSEDALPVFELTLKKEGVRATAVLENGEMVVQAGSLARKEYIGERSEKYSYWKLYDKLVDQGILKNEGQHKVFTENYAFTRTSAAGAVCNGRSTAGPKAWRLKGTNKTYAEWEAENLEN